MINISAHHIGIAVHGDWLFQNLSVEIKPQDRMAVIGPNGSGKTTLLQLLARQQQPDEGTVTWAKGLRVGLLDQIPVFRDSVERVLRGAFQELEVVEKQLRALEQKMALTTEKQLQRILADYATLQEQFEQCGGYSTDSKIRAVMDGLGIPQTFLTENFSSLSGGEQTKIGFARLLLSEPDVLLLDEPTNHLDLPSIEWLETYLSGYQGAVCMVSHDRYFLDRVATSVLELDSGEMVVYQGNYSKAMQQRENRLLLEFQAYQEQQKKMQQMRAAIKRLRQWANEANPPSAALHRRATSIQRALDRMEKLKRPQLERRQIQLSFGAQERSGQDVVQAVEVSKAYTQTPVLDAVSLHVRHGERVAIVGPNGSGKSTLIKLLLGKERQDTGEISLGPSVKIGYLSQLGLQYDQDITVLDAFREVVSVDAGRARHLLAQFLFYGEAVFKSVKNLSGGEGMRLRLAQLMHQDINFLVLDEPTNHLDIESRESLENAIENFPGTVLAVSHDRHFINLLFQRVLWLDKAAITSYLGSYDDARRKRQELFAGT